MSTAVVLFNRDLRIHDHPALRAALESSERVVPLFVFDEAILDGDYARPNRLSFLRSSLEDLRESLRSRGGELFLRRGDLITEVMNVVRAAGAQAVWTSEDYSAYARLRQRRLQRACARIGVSYETLPGVTVIAPGALEPGSSDHFKIFTPYYRKWSGLPKRSPLEAPRRVRVPPALPKGRLPPLRSLTPGETSAELPQGGESAARARLSRWLRSDLAAYEDDHDDLASDHTSRLSPYLHFGCLSAAEAVARAERRPGAQPFIRQLCWRDFHHQVLAATPTLPRLDYRPRGDRWRRDAKSLQAWKEGRTGVPIVDAGMRQLEREGFMHNRARLITASFLTKDLYIDWRLGAKHFWDLLVDGDIANNAGNWQWVAGTGNDTRPNRIFNPTRQAHRIDPDGDYVRRYVGELAVIEGPAVHEPWKLDEQRRSALDYPAPIVDHDAASRRFRSARG
ncbi:MAG TPA: deoxyribodipyrimidine photo-lyase [Actinomycetota bacterium]|nr:deoxyribodipyrimidine photo-lyase [Actinomycetota bacterium]